MEKLNPNLRFVMYMCDLVQDCTLADFYDVTSSPPNDDSPPMGYYDYSDTLDPSNPKYAD